MAREFRVAIATDLGRALAAHGADYLFIGKSGAIVLGFPGTTLDVDIFAARNPENGRRIVAALRSIGINVSAEAEAGIVDGRDFVQLKDGPFDVDVLFAPDGIPSYEDAKKRRIEQDGLQVASLDDIIASKRAAGRAKDQLDLPLLESFRQEYERLHPRPLKRAWEIDRQSS
jgi:hypothetical protein